MSDEPTDKPGDDPSAQPRSASPPQAKQTSAEPHAANEDHPSRTLDDTAEPTAPVQKTGQDVPKLELSAPAEELPRGTLLGHYVILGRLADAGAGVVYAAFDPDLDRKIALKLLALPTDLDDNARAKAQSRLIGEAQTAGNVSHPNVSEVYDVGTFDGGVFVATEYIDGIDLRTWMDARDEPFPWREVLRVYRNVGQGLVAAHEAGVIHRDFKPESVTLGKAGRVVIVDFGLASTTQTDEPDLEISDIREALPSAAVSLQSGSIQDVETDAVVEGTPGYMAPEQHVGTPPDAKADQFSFCVAFYEALYGERPFRGGERNTIALEVINNRVRDAPAGSDVPLWLRKVLIRGLSPRRSHRFPSMAALLRELDYDPKARRRRWFAGLAVVGVAGSLTAGTAYQFYSEVRNCEADEGLLAGAWDPQLHDTLHNAFLATGRPHAQDTWGAVEGVLEEWTQEWLDYRVRACRATRVQGDATEELMQRRQACLDARLAEVASFGRVFANADPLMVDRAFVAATSIELPRRCAHEYMLRYHTSAEPEASDKAKDALVDLDDTWTSLRAGRPDQARAHALALEPIFAEGNLPRALISLRLAQANIEQATGNRNKAETLLHTAATEATTAGLDLTLAQAWLAVAEAVGHSAERIEQAKTWASYAASVIARIDHEPSRIRVAMIRGDLARRAGQAGDALRHYHAALQAAQNNGKRHALDAARALQSLGELTLDGNEYATAQNYLERALDIRQKVLGPHHHGIARVLDPLARALSQLGDKERAIGSLERAVAVWLGDGEGETGQTAALRARIGNLRLATGQPEAALEQYQSAIETYRAHKDLDHQPLASALVGLGRTRLALGQFEPAKSALTEALTLREQANTTSPLLLAEAQAALAMAAWNDPDSREQALVLAGQARNTFMRNGDEAAAQRARLEAWLRSHQTE